MVELVKQRGKHRRFGEEIAQPVLVKLREGCSDLRWTVWTWDEYGVPYSTFQAKLGDLFVYIFWDREEGLFSSLCMNRKIANIQMLVEAEDVLIENDVPWTDEVDPWIVVANRLVAQHALATA